MFAEQSNIKAIITLKQLGNNVVTYLDNMKLKKLPINEKDTQAYTDRAFGRGIFVQLELAPVASFLKEQDQVESKWLFKKEVVTSKLLCQDVIFNFTIVILTTKFEQKIEPLTTERKSTKNQHSDITQSGK